jgi:ComEC/Rec2-related protein
MGHLFLFWPTLALVAFHLGVASTLFRRGMGVMVVLWLLTHERVFPRVGLAFACLGMVWSTALLPSAWKPLSWRAYRVQAQEARVMLRRSSLVWAERTSAFVEGRLELGIGERNAVFARALLLGGRLHSSKDAALARQAGVSHLTAVSGANLLFLLGILRLPFSGVRRWWMRWLLESVLAIAFVVATGGASSMMRAGVMWLFAASAPFIGRRYTFGRGLVITSWMFTVWQPWGWWFDIGLLLSSAACVGLLHASYESRDRGALATLCITQVLVSLWTMLVSWWIFPEWTWNGLLGTLLLSPFVNVLQGLTVVCLLFPFESLQHFLGILLDQAWRVMELIAVSGGVFARPSWRLWLIAGVGIALILRLIHKILPSWGCSITEWFGRTAGKASFPLGVRLFCVTEWLDRDPRLAFFLIVSMLRRSARQQQTNHS